MRVLASQCQRFQSHAIGHSGGFSKVGAYRAAEMEIRSQSGGSARGLHVADRPPLALAPEQDSSHGSKEGVRLC